MTPLPECCRIRSDLHLQAGQALLECLLVGAMVLLLWQAGEWLGQMQRLSAQAGLEARRTVFQLAAGMPAAAATVATIGQGRAGADGLEEPGVLTPATSVPERLQVAGLETHAWALRHDFGAQAGLWSAQTRLPAPLPPPGLSVAPMSMTLPAALVLLGGKGNGSAGGAGDAAVQQRIAAATKAWRSAAQGTMEHAAQLDRQMRRVDAPWRPGHDVAAWLETWAGAVPERLQAGSVR